MKFLAGVLVCAFAVVAVLGVFAMHHEAGHLHSGCIAVVATGANCEAPVGSFADTLAFLFAHFDASRSFSAAVVGSLIGGFFALLLLAGFSLLRTFFARAAMHEPARATGKARFYFAPPIAAHLRRWIALHETRDSASSA